MTFLIGGFGTADHWDIVMRWSEGGVEYEDPPIHALSANCASRWPSPPLERRYRHRGLLVGCRRRVHGSQRELDGVVAGEGFTGANCRLVTFLAQRCTSLSLQSFTHDI